MKKGNILIVDDNRGILASLELLLPAHFEQVVTTTSPGRIPELLAQKVDVVLLDMNFKAGINNGNEGLYWLREIKRIRPAVQVVLFTAYADIELAVTAIKDDAFDFLAKPWENTKLIDTLRRAVDAARGTKRSSAGTNSAMFWGSAPQMRALQQVVARVAATDANILIMGENGTGKEVLAREIHLLSHRSGAPFVAVDMGAITESLFESELFGYAKGAFTDAKADRIGKFEAASGGTLFLDEIGNLPLHLQAKLLAVLQTRQIVRLGENRPREIDVRIVTATNANLEAMVGEGRFREDLFYRINTIVVDIPPLRARREDIAALARLFIERYAAKYGKSCGDLTPEAAAKLSQVPWQGNIRQLQHTIEKGVILCDGELLDIGDLNLPQQKVNNGVVGAQTLEDMEREMIVRAMELCEGNLSEAAAKLGITRQTLYNKMKKWGI